MATLSTLTDDELADGICTWAGRVAAGEAELLRLIAEFDRREAWGGPGLLSCAQWLSWRIGLSPGAARERVRVARALDELPLVFDALSSGRVSFSQVRALTRVAKADDQQRWIELARSTTAGQLEKLVRAVRRAMGPVEDADDPERAAWLLRARKRYDDDGNAVYTVHLPAEQAAVFDAALQAVRAQLDSARSEQGDGVSAETPDQPAHGVMAGERGFRSGDADAGLATDTGAPGATVAEALVEMARRTLDDQAVRHPATARRTRSALVAQVDPLSGWGRLQDGELLPPTSMTSVLRTLPGRGRGVRLRPLTAADLRLHDLGRSQRLPSLALRELLGTLDGERCRFPGCTRRRKLHAHHVVRWSDGGSTDLANLLLLCSRHHTVVHQQGFSLTLWPARRLSVATADSVPVLPHPELPWRPAAELDPQGRVSAETLSPDRVEAPMDLGYAVMVLLQQTA